MKRDNSWYTYQGGCFRAINRSNFIYLRSDYGSRWEGEFHIRNFVFNIGDSKADIASIIAGSNSGQHDFGYPCYMPEKIFIENLYIDDSIHSENYQGPAIFSNFNPDNTDESYIEPFPYHVTREVLS
jgi:hypothetical protein